MLDVRAFDQPANVPGGLTFLFPLLQFRSQLVAIKRHLPNAFVKLGKP